MRTKPMTHSLGVLQNSFQESQGEDLWQSSFLLKLQNTALVVVQYPWLNLSTFN